MDIRIEDFAPEHFDAMTPRKEDAADIAGVPRETLLAGWEGGRTVFVDGEAAFIYGARVSGGTALLWAMTAKGAERVPLFATRLAKMTTAALFRAGCHRIEAYCHVRNARSLSWLTRSLGFSVEGLLRKSGPNAEDRFILSIIRGSAGSFSR